jgi:cysteine desulfurase family protein (TIGR01976 family)
MTTLDLDFVRREFPAFAEPSLAGFAHFENAGGSYACRQAIAWLERYYRQTKVQPYYAFAPSKIAGEQMDAAKTRLAAWLNVEADELHFGPSTSQNTYVLAQALREHLSAGDEVVVTNQDHEANVGAWRRLATAGIVVREWQVDRHSGELRIADLESLLGPRTRVVAFTHCSNVLATINPVRDITDLVHRAGAWAFVDGVSWCPHTLPDLAALGVDAYFFSLYKVYGPHLGAMYLRRELNAALPNQGHFFKVDAPAYRFTPAGPDHAQIAAVNGVVDYLEAVARHHGLDTGPPASRAAAVGRLFRAHETELLQPLLDRWAGDARIRLLGRSRAAERAPTVAFAVAGRRPGDVAQHLAAAGIGVGSGNFYAYRLVQALGFDPEEGVVRASFVHYTSRHEIARLIDAIDACVGPGG